MSRFFLKTSSETVAGPFTGIELREAAMANLVAPDTGVAGSAEGPWMRAADVGLFSEQNVPLPHPPGTLVPEFRVSGVGEAFEGPFQLHELIDFAARQILSGAAAIQPVGRPEWIPVDRIGILGACLRGELAPHRRPVASRSSSPNDHPRDDPPPSAARVASAALAANHAQVDLTDDPEEDIDSILSDHREQVRKNIREKIANKGSRPRFKPNVNLVTAGILVASLSVAALAAWWILQPPATSPNTDRTKLIGSWVSIPSHKEGMAFGIAFREDGTCVVFNSNGDCWTGEFEWLGNATSESRSRPPASMTGGATDVAPSHQRLKVRESDGCVRLKADAARQPPMLGDKEIRECFVRRDGDYLWIGYLAEVDPSGGSKSLQAGWAPLWPRARGSEHASIDIGMGGRGLLARYGVPDEARPLLPTEVPAHGGSKSAEPRSLIRYGTERLTLFSDGSVRRYKGSETSD